MDRNGPQDREPKGEHSMSVKKLVAIVSDKKNFAGLGEYIDFCTRFLEFASDGLQAVIVSQNEPKYRFFQYRKDGCFNVTRPLNSELMYDAGTSGIVESRFLKTIAAARDIPLDDCKSREIIRNSIYTIQQSIGAALDALPAGKSNTARKINGDLFERLIRLLIQRLGVDCDCGVVHIPVMVDGVAQFQMNYQHDLIVRVGEAIRVIGSVKTSSKDRIDKVFIDKFLYCRLAETDIPHIAVFLNDVQRKKTRWENRFGVSGTFLPGHFKGYTLKLNPLDGVYYCDLRPCMSTDALLKAHIRGIDEFFCRDLWAMLD
jgi:hypothetical protein